MVREAEEFASEDEAQRKRIEALNGLQNYVRLSRENRLLLLTPRLIRFQVFGLKTQLGDQEGLGGKISDEDKKTILAAVKDASEWIDANGQTATADELDEKMAGAYIRAYTD